MEALMTTPTLTAALRIAVLDRGFVYVGTCALADGLLTITDAHCIRRWGTTAGLGQLAAQGPQHDTTLDSAGRVIAPVSALIHLIDCDATAWATMAAA
jgi:hypothetical protein